MHVKHVADLYPVTLGSIDQDLIVLKFNQRSIKYLFGQTQRSPIKTTTVYLVLFFITKETSFTEIVPHLRPKAELGNEKVP